MNYKIFKIILALTFAGMHTVAFAATPVESVEKIHIHSGELPSVSMTPQLLYRLLVAELTAQQGNYTDASQQLLSVAQDTLDRRLAQRAFQMAMAGHNLPLALESSKEWARLDPENPDAVAASLALAASSGQTEGLAKTLSRRIAGADNKDDAIMQAVGITSRMSDKYLALEVLEKAFAKVKNDSALANLALADAAWYAGDPKKAVALAYAAQKIDPDSTDAAQRILEYGLRVQAHKAIQDTYAFIDDHPDERTVQLLLVSRLTGRKDFNEALGLLGNMRKRNPEDFDLLFTEAEVNARAANYDKAKAQLAEYISIQSQRRDSIADGASSAVADSSDARLLLVTIAEKQDDLAEAIRQLEKIDEPSLIFQAKTHQAVLYGKLGDMANARKTLDSIKPADRHERSMVKLTLASIYRDAGRTGQAIETLKEADLAMPDTADIKYDLGMLLHEQGKTKEFEALMRRVIELDPDNPNAYNSLGYTYAEQNRNLDEARGLLEQALDLDPDNPYILDSVGWYLFRINDYQGALEYLRRSYDELPAPDVAVHLAETLWVLDRKDEAKALLQKALKEEPDNELIDALVKRLKISLP